MEKHKKCVSMQCNREVNTLHCLPFDNIATDFQSSRLQYAPRLIDV